MQVTSSPVTALNFAVKDGGENALLRLDSSIYIGKELVKDLLQIEVPKSAILVHLGLLNALSSVLSNLEAMRVTFTDPVKALTGIGQYNKQMIEFQNGRVSVL